MLARVMIPLPVASVWAFRRFRGQDRPGLRGLSALFCAGCLLAATSGCGQKEPTPPPATGARQPPASAPTTSAPAPAPGTPAPEVKAVTETVVKAVDAAETAAAQASAQAQTLIDQAKALLSEKKYQDAVGAAQQLVGLKLSPDQQTLAAGLKTELAKMKGSIEGGLTNLQGIVARKDYAGGVALAKDLASYQLTPDQQKVLDGLKVELQKLAGSQATDQAKQAVGGLLDRKP